MTLFERTRLSIATVLIAILLSGHCLVWSQNAPDRITAYKPPRLVVVIVVDQMRPDYLTQFESLYHEGMSRLLHEGARFARAYHDHTNTETAVGHATIVSGLIPSKHGIVGNDWYEHETKKYIYCCDDTFRIIGKPADDGRSPRRLLTSTIGEWLKRSSPRSKVVSIALKDRAAILMGGHNADAAFWYDRKSGDFVTSTYYPQNHPEFLAMFNGLHMADSFFHEGWTRLAADSLYLAFAPSAVDSAYLQLLPHFPHAFDKTRGKPPDDYYKRVYATPFGDLLSFRLGEKAVQEYELGTDNSPDLLFISCSSADAIGHAYGPSSPEVMDYYLRLDNYLGELFASLDRKVGREYYSVVLSSDHGVMPLPEELKKQGLPAKRLSFDSARADMKKIGADVASELQLSSSVVADCGYEVILDYGPAGAHDVTKENLQNMVAARLRQLSYIADVYTISELLSSKTHDRLYLSMFRNVARADRGPDIYLRFAKYCLSTNDPIGTSHGSPYEYDTHVPLIIAGSGILAGNYSDSVRTVDVAPTVAEMLGIAVPDSLDGHSLWQKVHH